MKAWLDKQVSHARLLLVAWAGQASDPQAVRGLLVRCRNVPVTIGQPCLIHSTWMSQATVCVHSDALSETFLHPEQVGAEKLELAKLLQEHAVIVRGGPEHAQRLIDALIVRLHLDWQ